MDKNKILKIQELRNQGFSFNHIASIIGITKSQANYYGKIDLKRYEKKQSTQKKFEEYVCNLIPQCDNINQVCRLLGHKGTNTYYKQIENIIIKYHIDTSHFGKNKKTQTSNERINTTDLLCKGSKISSAKLKNRLLDEGYKEHKCENPLCQLTEWNGKPIPLELHHINGDNTDNRLENLQMLCPNCHAQTDTYCRKKTVKKEKVLKKDAHKTISKEEILDSFKKHGTFVGVSEDFSVSSKMIRKLCEKFDLPSNSKEMRLFLKEKYGNIKWNITNGNAETLRNISFFRKKCLIDDDNNIIKIYSSQKEIEEDGFSASKVNEVCKGIRKTHKNRKFVFYETD